ncbi:MAG: phage portal protein, partial [Planctomycetota bacterium]
PTDGDAPLLFGQVYDAPPESLGITTSRRNEKDPGPLGWVTRLWSGLAPDSDQLTVLELLGKDGWQTYHLDPATQRLTLQQRGEHPLGRLPVVHVQNIVRPFDYDGGSDVEPLVPLQDQLNTRLSDRAQRLTMQSAKIYLGVGIDDFANQPVAPGRMWSTENPDARIDEFGGDTHSPAEDAAVREIRDALDKQSGVSPIAAGAIRNRVGNLTSAAALRLTFQALISRTQRKRINYGTAIEQVCDLALAWLDAVGVVKTSPQDRRVRLTWPDPIPVDSSAELAQAKQKLDLGIDRALVLRELGYPEPADPQNDPADMSPVNAGTPDSSKATS